MLMKMMLIIKMITIMKKRLQIMMETKITIILIAALITMMMTDI